MILCATKRFTIRKPKKDRIEPHTNIIYATESAAISSLVLKSAVDSLLENSGKDQRLLLAMMAAIWRKQSVDPQLIETLNNGLCQMKKEDIEFSSALLTMPFKQIFAIFGQDSEEDISILKHMHLYALEHIQNTFKDNNLDIVKSAISFDSAIIPGLIGGLWSDSKKVRKKIIKCFEIMLEKPVARANYTPLLKAFVNNKAAILSTSDNIPDVIKTFTEETRTSPTILGTFFVSIFCIHFLFQLFVSIFF